MWFAENGQSLFGTGFTCFEPKNIDMYSMVMHLAPQEERLELGQLIETCFAGSRQ